MATGGGRTEDRTGPSKPLSEGRQVLIVVHPKPRVVPVPEGGDVIGRSWLAQWGIDDPKASDEHCRITRRGGLRVEDLGSRNGTWIELHRLVKGESVALEDGGLLHLGRTFLIYRKHFIGPNEPSPDLGDMVGPYGLREVHRQLDRLAEIKPKNVLIEGETGTGKELLAREIRMRLRPQGKYAAASPRTSGDLFASELFGHAPGAFTGASRRGAPGLILANDGGTLFLDEVGELPLLEQPKLLRFLQEGDVQKVGSSTVSKADVIVVAATNRSLADMVKEGRFREDLLFRLQHVLFRLPPLRDRREDIMPIVVAWYRKNRTGLAAGEIRTEAVERLLTHEWKGNIRGLENSLRQIAALDRPGALSAEAVHRVLGPLATTRAPLTLERAMAALERNHQNQTKAAEDLGVERSVLLRILRKARKPGAG